MSRDYEAEGYEIARALGSSDGIMSLQENVYGFRGGSELRVRLPSELHDALLALARAKRDAAAAVKAEREAAKRKPDLYWPLENMECSFPDANEALGHNAISDTVGEITRFSVGFQGGYESWMAIAADENDQPCPKCGGRSYCDDYLGEGCAAERVMMVKVAEANDLTELRQIEAEQKARLDHLRAGNPA